MPSVGGLYLQGDGDAVQHEAVSPVVMPPAPLVLVTTLLVQSTRLLADGEVGRVAGGVGCNTTGSISSSLEGHRYVGLSFSSVLKYAFVVETISHTRLDTFTVQSNTSDAACEVTWFSVQCPLFTSDLAAGLVVNCIMYGLY